MPRFSRRTLLKGGVAAGALGAAGWGSSLTLAEAPGTRGVDQGADIPKARKDLNLLILMVDQERAWDTLPASLSMPNHHAIAEAGTSFTNMNCTTPLCTPSRSVIWSGQHVQHTGIFDNVEVPVFGRRLDPAIPTLGHMLREMGVYTAYKGKWHLSGLPKDAEWGASSARKDALQEYGYSDYGWGEELIDSHDGWKFDGRIADDAAHWLMEKSVGLDAPWALTVSFVNPHDIMFFDATGDQAEDRVQNVFPGPLLGLPDDPIYRDTLVTEMPRNFRSPDYDGQTGTQADYDRYMDYFYGAMPHDNVDAWVRFANYYYNCIRDVDRHLGTVLGALEASGQADNTIIVLLSDHGEMGGVHGLRQKGPWMYRENLAVPFIVSHPDARMQRTNTGVASTLDFAPTMLGFMGAEPDAVRKRYTALGGRDLSNDLTEISTSRSRDASGALVTYSVIHHADPEFARAVLHNRTVDGFFERNLNMARAGFVPDGHPRSFIRGIITDTHKFARYFSPQNHHTATNVDTLLAENDLELFDLQADPGETENLAANGHVPAELLASLNAKLNDLVAQEVGIDDGSHMPGPGFLWKAS